MKKTICVDFDGVIAQVDGEFEPDKFGEPVQGVQNALKVLKKEGYTIIVYITCKATAKLKRYLEKNDITYDAINKNPDQPDDANQGKPIADIYLDDRAICFRGDWRRALENIASFQPYTSEKRDEKKEFEKAFADYKKWAKERNSIAQG